MFMPKYTQRGVGSVKYGIFGGFGNRPELQIPRQYIQTIEREKVEGKCFVP